MATSSLIDAAQVHFISATPSVVTPCEVGEFAALDGDLVEGLKIDNGHVRVPPAPAWACLRVYPLATAIGVVGWLAVAWQ
jgi:hypothetical protein